MVQLRADPWRPDHGMGAEAPFEDEMSKVVVDPEVETTDWSTPLSPEPSPPEPVTFVDGVMRTELRVMGSEGERRAWGLLGSYAAGGVLCDGTAAFVAEDFPVGRALIMGGRINAPLMQVEVGASTLTYEPFPVADDSPMSLRRSLQRLMLGVEQDLAAQLSSETLVFADGPLHLNGHTSATVVGVVKRMVTAYLTGEPAALLPKLRPGQRTPLFGLGNNVLDRFAWYVRLIDLDPTWHELAGLVRCEVRMSHGIDEARRLADLVACHLPQFAGRPGVDPRAPQNLTPVGALEARLKHRLGSAAYIGRALTAHLAGGIADE